MLHSALRAFFTALLVLAVHVTPAAAQGNFALDLDALRQNISRVIFRVDADYAAKTGREVNIPFEVEIPTARNRVYVSRANSAPKTGQVTFSFSTRDGDLVEALNISDGVVPLGTNEARLEQLAVMINRDLSPVMKALDSQAEPPRIRVTDLDGRPAVEVFGIYTHPEFGQMRWRIVGLPHPDKPVAIIALSQVSLTRVTLKSPDEMALTLGGRVLESLKFLP